MHVFVQFLLLAVISRKLHIPRLQMHFAAHPDPLGCSGELSGIAYEKNWDRLCILQILVLMQLVLYLMCVCRVSFNCACVALLGPLAFH